MVKIVHAWCTLVGCRAVERPLVALLDVGLVLPDAQLLAPGQGDGGAGGGGRGEGESMSLCEKEVL